MISREQVLHVAKLARLKLTEQEVESFTGQIGSILEHIEQLNKVNTDNVEPTNFMVPKHDPLRDDVEVQSLPQEQILMNGPNTKKGCFAVPKVIGGN